MTSKVKIGINGIFTKASALRCGHSITETCYACRTCAILTQEKLKAAKETRNQAIEILRLILGACRCADAEGELSERITGEMLDKANKITGEYS